jgi:TolB-like protein
MPTAPSGSVTREDDLVPDNGGQMTLDRVFSARRATPEELRRELSGDLDKVILKALRKRPEERYANAVEFADDITNFLEGRPVQAEYFVSMTNISRSQGADKLSIAILPFKVLSAGEPSESGAEFVGIGMADALVSRLSGVQRLIVRPTTSVLPFEKSDPMTAAQQLGVNHVLDGSVRVLGGRIRVSVQLYNVERNATEWARAFDKEVGDVLEVEDSIASEVAAALLPQLSNEEQNKISKRGTIVPDAYAAYIRGRYQWSRFT